jgi:hypothetical protein
MWLRYHPFENADNLRLLDEALMTSEFSTSGLLADGRSWTQGNNDLAAT